MRTARTAWYIGACIAIGLVGGLIVKDSPLWLIPLAWVWVVVTAFKRYLESQL